MPDALVNKPTLSRSAEDLWEAFWAMHASRQVGYSGSQSLSMSDLKAYWDLTQSGMTQSQIANIHARNGLYTVDSPPSRPVDCVINLHVHTWSKRIPAISNINEEVFTINTLPQWMRVKRFLTSMQRMDAIYINFERSKQS